MQEIQDSQLNWLAKRGDESLDSRMITSLEAQGFAVTTQEVSGNEREAIKAYYGPARYIATKEFTGSGEKHTVMVAFTPLDQGQSRVFSFTIFLDGVEQGGNHDANKDELASNISSVCAMAEHNIEWNAINASEQARNLAAGIRKAILLGLVPITTSGIETKEMV